MLCNSQGLRAPARDVAAGDASRPEESQHPAGRRVARGRGGGQGVRLWRFPQRRAPHSRPTSGLSWYHDTHDTHDNTHGTHGTHDTHDTQLTIHWVPTV